MEFCTLASGSSGNCIVVSQGKRAVLVDAGISMRRIVRGLKELSKDMRDLAGILITHEHADHISGLKMLCKYYDIPVYAPYGVMRAIADILPETADNLRVFELDQGFELDGFSIQSFLTPHDTPQSVGYRIEAAGRSLAVATDLGSVPAYILDAVRGVDAAIIEANHDVQMLQEGPYPYYLKQRVLSNNGHLSNDSCGKLARVLMRSGTQKLVLGHLSRQNNTPRKAYDTVTAELRRDQALIGREIELHVAPADMAGGIYTV